LTQVLKKPPRLQADDILHTYFGEDSRRGGAAADKRPAATDLPAPRWGV